MQNLPTVSALPVASAPAPTSSTTTPTSTDNAAGQITEPFGQILARQQSSSSPSQDGKKTDTKQSKPSTLIDSASLVTNNQPVQAPAPDPSLAGSILATFLPASIVTGNPAAPGLDKSSSKDSTSGVSTTLASDMLAMMLPANSGASIVTASGNEIKGTLAKAGNVLASEANTVDSLGGTSQSALKKSTPVASGFNGTNGIPSITDLTASVGLTNKVAGINEVSGPATASDSVQVSTAAPTINVASVKESAFSSALQTLSKQSTHSAANDTSGTTVNQLQQVAPTGIDSSLQNAALIHSSSQNSTIQAAQTVINTPVTNQAWGNEFNQKITWMATKNQQTAELHLNPPNLGPLDVVLKVSGDQATALFTSPHAAVRDAVQQALPQLRDMLAGNGITLGNAMVSDQSPKDQHAWQASQQQRNNRGSTGSLNATATSASISSVAAVSLVTRHQGMVDTFA